MQAEDFFRVVSEVEFICDDIDELMGQSKDSDLCFGGEPGQYQEW